MNNTSIPNNQQPFTEKQSGMIVELITASDAGNVNNLTLLLGVIRSDIASGNQERAVALIDSLLLETAKYAPDYGEQN